MINKGNNVSNIYIQDNYVVKSVHVEDQLKLDNLLYEYLIGIRLNYQNNFIQTIKFETIQKKIDITHLLQLDKASSVYSLNYIPHKLYINLFKGVTLYDKVFSISFFQLKIFFLSLANFFLENRYFRHNDLHWHNIMLNDNTFVLIDYARSEIIGILEYDFDNKNNDIVSILNMLLDCLQIVSRRSLKEKLMIIQFKRNVKNLKKKIKNPEKNRWIYLKDIISLCN